MTKCSGGCTWSQYGLSHYMQKNLLQCDETLRRIGKDGNSDTQKVRLNY